MALLMVVEGTRRRVRDDNVMAVAAAIPTVSAVVQGEVAQRSKGPAIMNLLLHLVLHAGAVAAAATCKDEPSEEEDLTIDEEDTEPEDGKRWRARMRWVVTRQHHL